MTPCKLDGKSEFRRHHIQQEQSLQSQDNTGYSKSARTLGSVWLGSLRTRVNTATATTTTKLLATIAVL